ncbi:MAG: hypothetical protein ACKVH8_18175 [Pirellulales bacterium]
MQNSELFCRGIVLPESLEAEDLLRKNNVTEETPVRYLEIPSQAFFEALWHLGLFSEINSKANSLIDDYEEEFIEAIAIDSVVQSVSKAMLTREAQTTEIQLFLNELLALALESKKTKRPLLFVM